MADQPSIFESTAPTEATPQTQTSAPSNSTNVSSDDMFADLRNSIKNEAGLPKYKDTTEALNGLKHAQEFIPQLKTQLSESEREKEALRKEVERLSTIEETVRRLTEHQETAPQPNGNGLDEQKIADLINRTISQKEIASQQKQNLASVVTSLQQSFGADAEKVFYSKATELGMDVQGINALAAKSPQAVLALFGVKGTTPPQEKHVPTSGVNSSGFQPVSETFVSRSKASISIGATSSELMQEHHNSKKMVEELHQQGLSVHDLSDPKQYFKFFK